MKQNATRRHCRASSLGGAAAALSLALLCGPAPAEAQVLGLLRAINDGGSWINLEVKEGRADYRSPVFPVAGMAVKGCVKIWDGNPGSWTLRAKDLLGEAELEVTTDSAKPVRFDYKGGLQAQLDLEVEWSEPGGTTLYIWVGVSLKEEQDEEERDICEPPPSNPKHVHAVIQAGVAVDREALRSWN